MSTAKKFHYIIQFMPAQNVASVSNNDFIPINDTAPQKLQTTSIEVTEKPKATSAGTLIDQQLNIQYNHSTRILNQLIRTGLIFRLVRDNGDIMFFGNIDNPAYFDSGLSNLAKGNLTFHRRSTRLEWIENKDTQFDS